MATRTSQTAQRPAPTPPAAPGWTARCRPVLAALIVVSTAAGVLAAVTARPESSADARAAAPPAVPSATTGPNRLSGAAVGATPAPVPAAPRTGSPPSEPLPTRMLDGSVASPAEVRRAAAAAPAAAPPAASPRQPLRPQVHPADLPDPALLWASGQFYLFSTNSDGRNIPVIAGANLHDWLPVGDALPELPSWAIPGNTWAPAAQAVGGRFVLYFAAAHVGTGRHCIGRAVADGPYGPYRATGGGPLLCDPVPGTGAIDPQPFVTGDGRVFLYWKSVGGRGQQIWATELSRDGLTVTGAPVHLLTATERWEGGGIENPAMVAAGGAHWLFYSANWWIDDRYSIGYARCDGPLGPCAKHTVPGPWRSTADGALGPGGASFAVDGRGQAWMAYHAWSAGAPGYDRGGRRQAHVEPVGFDGGAPVVLNRRPAGAITASVRRPGGLSVSGWAVDPDTGRPLTARLVGAAAASVRADRPDAALLTTHPQAGVRHGFAAGLSLPAGRHRLCLTVDDDLGGPATSAGCRIVEVRSQPVGELERVESTGDGVVVAGWALDPDTAAPIEVAVTVDGGSPHRVRADRRRTDLDGAYWEYGQRHGWQTTLQLRPGRYTVCASARDAGGRGGTDLGCRPVEVSALTLLP